MNEAKIEVQADGEIAITGELNHQTVPALLKKSAEIISSSSNDQSNNLSIDLNAVSRSDSSGVALLIEWMRLAKKDNRVIRFTNMPKQMHEIAEVSGVDKLLAM